MALRVLSAVLFSPRGGSAHVARALARGLRAQGCAVTLVAGSRGGSDAHGDAEAFYGDVHAVDFGPALATEAPLRFEGRPGTAPMHPSFEERPGAPDRVFAMLDDLDYERQVRTWSRELESAGAREADVLHLHHLTPLNEAAARIAPGVPVVGQLHGTELLMLEQIEAGAPASWEYAERWAERLRLWAQRCACLLAAPAGTERAATLLGVSPERVIPLPNGADLESFRTQALDRGAFWQAVLVEEPQGWLPGKGPGSVRYAADDVAGLAERVVLIYVGRFTKVKRLDRLIGAFARAQQRVNTPAGLVLVGGHPGEWEGEHPAELATSAGAPAVFLAGWHSHEELPRFFSASDAVVLTSEREQFGQVLVEGMACEVPAIATRSLGPDSIIEDGKTGWLVDHDEQALADALVEAIDDQDERKRRGRIAAETVRERFSWRAISERLASVLEEVAGKPRKAPVRGSAHET